MIGIELKPMPTSKRRVSVLFENQALEELELIAADEDRSVSNVVKNMLPGDLLKQLREAASKENRSATDFLVLLVRESLSRRQEEE